MVLAGCSASSKQDCGRQKLFGFWNHSGHPAVVGGYLQVIHDERLNPREEALISALLSPAGPSFSLGYQRTAATVDHWLHRIYNIYDVYQPPSENVMRVAKWGNSLAIRLPAAVVEALKLKEGDEIEVHILAGREMALARKPGREELLARLRAFRGRLPPEFKFDRDEANAR
jgi:antitoxin MazE